MSEASDALAEVRRWLCDNLTPADAGEICGKLSVVSRRMSELEELVKAFDWCTENLDDPYECDRCPLKQSNPMIPECVLMMRKLGIRRSNGL